MTDSIAHVRALRVWDSRGLPTIEVEVRTERGHVGRGIAPSGASTGRREANELRDGGPRLGGKDVQRAVAVANEQVAQALLGHDVADQEGIDNALDALDVDPARSSVGGNTTTATSLAVLQAAAASQGVAVWQLLNATPTALPRPQIQIMGGGAHAAHRTAVQDFMVVPLSARNIDEAFAHVAEVYLAVGDVLATRGPKRGVADEGGYWPEVADTTDALEVIIAGIDKAGFVPGTDIGISLDIAASQFLVNDTYRVGEVDYSTAAWIDLLAGLCRDFPIVTLEDPAGEDDTEGMRLAVAATGAVTKVVGDDYLVTDAQRIEQAAVDGAVESVLVKVNQVGTVSGAARAVEAARSHGLQVIVSARSGETEDVAVSHLATGWGADLVKVGSIARGERTAKWNELIRINAALGGLGLR
ncbi:MAG: enolase C-terminal domain-like protein [Arachnia sp.]